MAINNPRICIDARFYGIKHTGIGRYVENLIKNLPGKVTLIVNPEDYYLPELAGFPKLISHTHPYSVLSQFEIPYLLFTIQCQLLHVPYSSIPVLWPGKVIVTFHDLIKHISKGKDTTTKNMALYWFKYYGYILIDFISIHRASAIIVPVNYWKKVMLQKFKISPSKIHVTYEAVSDEFISLEKKPVKNLHKPFLVHTGNLYPHKNLIVVFQALKKININLYLICARSVFAQRAEQLVAKYRLQNKVTFLGRINDAETKYVYSQALALVFPSKVEGFGLNGLEAMSVGLPVLSSSASCLPEVYGKAALYFDPDSSDDLIKQINLLPQRRQYLIKAGYRQVKKYSWSKMANETWEIYQNV